MVSMLEASAPIGVFDSGIGGLSVLQALRLALPNEQFVYFADTAHAPYGEKGDAFVRERSAAITQQLRDKYGIKALVVACNTATAAAIAELRGLHPDLSIIGIEPALKPAAAHSNNKRVTVFATRGTLASVKFKHLLAQQSAFAQFTCIACDGLAQAIERHHDGLNHSDIAALVRQYVAAAGLEHSTHPSDVKNAINQSDAVVLGCTHYPLVKPLFEAALAPHIHIVDNGAAVAKRLYERLHGQSLLRIGTAPVPVTYISSAAVKIAT